MNAEQTELYGLLIPLKHERLLVPRMCVAEVIGFAEADAAVTDSTPEWYLGTVEWNGRQLPIVSFDGQSEGERNEKKRSRARIVVFHAVTGQLKGGFYGILTQGFPQLVRVNSDVLTYDSNSETADAPPFLCRVRMIHEYPLIPDVERLESMLVIATQASTHVAPQSLQ